MILFTVSITLTSPDVRCTTIRCVSLRDSINSGKETPPPLLEEAVYTPSGDPDAPRLIMLSTDKEMTSRLRTALFSMSAIAILFPNGVHPLRLWNLAFLPLK